MDRLVEGRHGAGRFRGAACSGARGPSRPEGGEVARRRGNRGWRQRFGMARFRTADGRRRPLGFALRRRVDRRVCDQDAGRHGPRAGRLQSRADDVAAAAGKPGWFRLARGAGHQRRRAFRRADAARRSHTPARTRGVDRRGDASFGETRPRSRSARRRGAERSGRHRRRMVRRHRQAYDRLHRHQAFAARLFRPAGAHAGAGARVARQADGGDARPQTAACADPVARRSAARDGARRILASAGPHRISRDAGGRLDAFRQDPRRRFAPAELAQRPGDRRATHQSAGSADRPTPAGDRRRVLRAERRAAGGLSAESHLAQPLRRLGAALRAAPGDRRPGDRRFHGAGGPRISA